MYRAKESDTSCAFYETTQDVYDPARLTLVGELRDAIESRGLVLHYQPITSLETGRIHSVEALLRWNHPWRGTILPDQFLPLLQQTSLLKPLTLYVIGEALRQSAAWRADGLALPIAVNLSPRNLLDVELPGDVRRLLEESNADPATIELELTESTMVADPARSKLVLEELAAIGIRLAIDDYGSGYSSLGYLTRLPISTIKIDRSFVLTMAHDEGNSTIVRSTIELARNLGLDIVAEGVETREVWQRLRTLGCTYAQGYYVAPPQPAAELGSWLRERRRAGPVAGTAA
jgi:EAL domain-containing protein (putative c-di-GMP-specific phosphodiesterase class I)